MTVKRKRPAKTEPKPEPVLFDPTPIRRATAHGLTALLYRRLPPPPSDPVDDPWAAAGSPPWLQPSIDAAHCPACGDPVELGWLECPRCDAEIPPLTQAQARDAAIARLTADERAALGLS